VIILVSTAALFGQARVLTWHNDNARTGQNLQETTLTPGNVSPSTFGKLFVINVDGKVDAEPLYVPSLTIAGGAHNVLFVVTEHDSAYAFDADTGSQLWHVSLPAASETASDPPNGCGQIVPEIGITSTPVIDLNSGPHGTMYVVAMSKNGTTYYQRLHALDLTTGGEEFGGPVEIQATYPGSGAGSVNNVVTFDPKQYKERAALVLLNGVVYTSWASHCDIPPYTAWVIGYNEATLARVSILNLTPNGSDGSSWGAGAGLAADAGGALYFLMANGTFDTTLNFGGFPMDGDYGNAFMKLSTGGGTLSVADYFTMSNTVSESAADQDLGSGGSMLLPPLADRQGNPRNLAVGAGKDGNIYVVDTANMGKFNASQNNIYQELPSAVGPVFSSPAWFNGRLYYGGSGDTIKAFSFASGAFGSSPSSQTALTFPYPGATPSISANGTSNGIVWAAENGATAVLHAYDANDLATGLYNSNMAAKGQDHFGAGNKFIVPMVANGKVYVGTTNGVGVFGLLCSYAIAPQGASFGAGGGSGQVNVSSSNGCAWTTANNPGWIAINSGASGSGNGIVSYTVAANPSRNWRAGPMTIAGATLMVTQTGTPPFAGDFDGNGVPDLVWQNDTSSQVVVWYMGGAGGATFQGFNYLDSAGHPGWHVITAADFSGDGVPDVVWQNDATRQVTVWYMGGAGGATFQGYDWLSQSGVPGWHVVAAADFNGDGVPDLVWQNDATRQVTVWYMGEAGGATFQGYNWLSQSGVPGWHVVAVADFNGDGVPDVVWQNDATRQVTVWYMSGAGGATFQSYNWLSQSGVPGWHVVAAADFNGDGEPDLVWQNDTTRQVTVWYMGGAGGAVFQGFNWLDMAGHPGWSLVHSPAFP